MDITALTTSLQGRYYYHAHFTEEETDSWTLICPQLNKKVEELR